MLACLAACGSPDLVTLAPLATTRAYLVAEVEPEGRVRALTAYDVGSVARLEIERTDDTLLRVLELDGPIDRFTVADASGGVSVLPLTASIDEAWPLERPTRTSELRGASGGFVESTGVDAWLATFRVPRPPCPGRVGFAPMALPYPTRGVSLVMPLGDHVLIGQHADQSAEVLRDRAPLLYRVDLATRVIEDLTGQGGLAYPSTLTQGAIGFLDEGQAWILWPIGTSTASHALVPIAADGTVGPATPVTMDPALDSFNFSIVAAARYGGQRTLVAITGGGHLVAFDEATRHWSVVDEPIGMGVCSGHTTRLVLDLDGPGRGFVGLRAGSIVRFDLSRPQGQRIQRTSNLISGGPFCRNVRRTLDSGLDVLVYEADAIALPAIVLSWRLPGMEGWERVTNGGLLAHAIAPAPSGFVVSGENDTVVYYEHTSRRAELAPRECGLVAVARSSVYELARVSESEVIVGGSSGAGYLDFPGD